MPHRQMNGFARLPVQFLKVWQTDAANIELSHSRLADGETRDPQVIHPVSTAVQKTRAFQIREKTVDRTHRQPGTFGHMFRREPVRRLAENVKKTQAALQRSDVVASFWSISHKLIDIEPSTK